MARWYKLHLSKKEFKKGEFKTPCCKKTWTMRQVSTWKEGKHVMVDFGVDWEEANGQFGFEDGKVMRFQCKFCHKFFAAHRS